MCVHTHTDTFRNICLFMHTHAHTHRHTPVAAALMRVCYGLALRLFVMLWCVWEGGVRGYAGTCDTHIHQSLSVGVFGVSGVLYILLQTGRVCQNMHTRAVSLPYTLTHSHTHLHSLTRTQIHTHTHTLTHSHTHTHTRTLIL